jgi:t-SNARE complex subunit (syntaxin)
MKKWFKWGIIIIVILVLLHIWRNGSLTLAASQSPGSAMGG